jgi:hypothetical protein
MRVWGLQLEQQGQQQGLLELELELLELELEQEGLWHREASEQKRNS